MKKKCDVLYVHSVREPHTMENSMFAIMPMGIIGILNGLRAKGIDVMGINLAVEKHVDPDYDLKEALKDIEYKVILTDLHWYVHSYGAMYVVEQTKAVHPEIPVIVGGYTSTIYPQEIMENFEGVDYVVTGDSDLPMDMLVDYLLGRKDIAIEDIPNILYRKDGEIITSEKTWAESSLDQIDFIHTDFFEHPDLVRRLTVNGVTRKFTNHWLCIARGCKFNCGYCCGSNVNMKTLFRRCNILKRSPEKVAQDFVALHEMGYMQISPSHDFEMFGQEYYRKIFSTIREAGVKPGMYLECFQLPSKDYIDEIAETFDKKQVLLVISPISGNDELRRQNGKMFSNDELYEMLKYIRKKGLPILLYYTFNLVGETRQQFMDTIFQMQYLGMSLKFNKKSILYQPVVLDPLAPMRSFDGITSHLNCFMDYYNHCQLPRDGKYENTGYDDNNEVSVEEKLKTFDSILS